ncbi:hypothetical protein PENANT_c088G09736 [Penicillium antarcticum]|uniref:Uncharacterized protein n=1 Tax=Penicillium antarcticum TaxID=416450 RepID=A0A1V6PNJ1_9EURO|nr:hypothetical protein PENANT_c088G09736 [Penicillium antarcticum]
MRNAWHVALEIAGGATGGADKQIIRLAAAAKRMVRGRIQDRWKQWESKRTSQPQNAWWNGRKATLGPHYGAIHELFSVRPSYSLRSRERNAPDDVQHPVREKGVVMVSFHPSSTRCDPPLQFPTKDTF